MLLDIDGDGIGGFAIDSEDNVHFTTTDERAGQRTEVGLVKAEELRLDDGAVHPDLFPAEALLHGSGRKRNSPFPKP